MKSTRLHQLVESFPNDGEDRRSTLEIANVLVINAKPSHFGYFRSRQAKVRISATPVRSTKEDQGEG